MNLFEVLVKESSGVGWATRRTVSSGRERSEPIVIVLLCALHPTYYTNQFLLISS